MEFCRWSLFGWLLFCNPRCRSRSQSCGSSDRIAPPPSVWKWGGGDNTPLLVTSGLDSWRPAILPPHLLLTPAIGTLGTVCSIIPTLLSSLCSTFVNTTLCSFRLFSDSTLSSFIPQIYISNHQLIHEQKHKKII